MLETNRNSRVDVSLERRGRLFLGMHHLVGLGFESRFATEQGRGASAEVSEQEFQSIVRDHL